VIVVSRFAPAPTGLLHLGHVVNAIYVWGVVRTLKGRVLLRIEDHDRQRSRPAFERAILDDLDWLGFVPDDPPTSDFRAGRCDGRQSDRHEVYVAAIEDLRAQGMIYGCTCSRRQGGGAVLPGHEQRYPGTCAAKGLPAGPGVGIRLRLVETTERFDDLRHGPMMQSPAAQCGDLLLRDRAGNWTYQFAAAVDDWAQRVTLVIRGDDLLPSVGRQIYLARCLGRHTPPLFLHHPLVMKTATKKLSKSDGDRGVRDLRASGLSAPDVIGRAAKMAGLVDTERPVTAAEVPVLVCNLAHLRSGVGPS
jgi:glutamyl-tRNA synthetase/glutamyl-Q tRNA(Asp) synthetase